MSKDNSTRNSDWDSIDVFAICTAYESGFGHGIEKRTDVSNPYEKGTNEFEAYDHGYELGESRADMNTPSTTEDELKFEVALRQQLKADLDNAIKKVAILEMKRNEEEALNKMLMTKLKSTEAQLSEYQPEPQTETGEKEND